jgi:hypothetical protein
MTTELEKASNVFEQVIDNFRKTAESNFEMQQEMFRKWSTMWPTQAPQSAWVDQVKRFQKEWSQTVSDLVHKHRDVLNRQYQSAVESLDEMLRVTESKDPEEFRQRVEQLCRKTIDCVREIGETQLKELQDSVNRWSELVTKK